MKQLLNKTRMINELLQKENTLSMEKILPYNYMADILGDILESNAYILNKEGVLLGYMIVHDFNTQRVQEMVHNQQFPDAYIRHLHTFDSTMENIGIEHDSTVFPVELREELPDAYTTIIPMFGAGERLGTIILGRIGKKFNDVDLILGEYSATVIGMQILYQQSREQEENIRHTTTVQLAMSTLSYSELKAVEAIFNELEEDEGRVTASTVADKVGITRSVIVNALRKLESAGVIETRSLGMKGTYIKIINPLFKEELTKQSLS